jgi:hypothetical protein
LPGKMFPVSKLGLPASNLERVPTRVEMGKSSWPEIHIPSSRADF